MDLLAAAGVFGVFDWEDGPGVGDGYVHDKVIMIKRIWEKMLVEDFIYTG